MDYMYDDYRVTSILIIMAAPFVTLLCYAIVLQFSGWFLYPPTYIPRKTKEPHVPYRERRRNKAHREFFKARRRVGVTLCTKEPVRACKQDLNSEGSHSGPVRVPGKDEG